MRHRLPGLNQASRMAEIPDGTYLVRVQRAQYRWDRRKPFYAIQFTIVEPKNFAGRLISTRIYCTKKVLWKLSWFLRDFRYDSELLERDELEESSLLGLQGVIKISHTTVNGTSLLNLAGFAPAAQWPDLSAASGSGRAEVA